MKVHIAPPSSPFPFLSPTRSSSALHLFGDIFFLGFISGADLLALTPMDFPTDWGLSVEQEGAVLAAVHTLRSSILSASTATVLSLDLSLLLFWPKTLVEGARTARSHRYPFESPLCGIGGYAKLRDQLGSEEFERLLPSKLRISALEALTAEAKVSSHPCSRCCL